MTVKEFIDEYNKVESDSLKIKRIKSLLNIKEYVGFAEKCNLADRIVKYTTYEINDDGKIDKIKINSALRYLLSTLSTIDIYTDINIDFENIFEEYDLLNKNGIIDLLLMNDGLIPSKEYTEFQFVIKMKLDDVLQNNLTTQAFISNQVDRFGNLIGITISPILTKLIDSLNGLDDETIDKVIKRIIKK